ncbi:MAG: SURF1 family protein [Alphaproteobacteria bacterium]|nr:MAG: SURF1 family protein [Alphaproteobacteria bacterium]
MTRTSRRFRPGIGASVLTLLGLALLIGLGTWQLQRLAWKQALLAEIAARTTAAPVTLPARIAEPQDWRYRRVTVSGHFDHAHEMLIAAGRGWQVITPLLRDGAPAVFVVRGFVPEAKRSPDARPEGQISGGATVTGIVRLAPSRKGWFTPENVPAAGRWYWRDLDAMARAAGLGEVLPVFVEAEASAPGGWPQGGVTRLDIPNHHLQYALTWYALALVLLVIYILAGVRRAKER